MKKWSVSVDYVKDLLGVAYSEGYDVEEFEGTLLDSYIIYAGGNVLDLDLGVWNYILIQAIPRTTWTSEYELTVTNDGNLVEEFISNFR